MITTKTETNTLLINGPAGQLEIVVNGPTNPARKIWGIICHPHPLYGGTMNNKVVTTLAKTFQALGVHTVRFNFRGVGKSAGRYDNGIGELEDLIAVMDWVGQEHPKDEVWLSGFSFGGYIAVKAATQIPVSRLIAVAPSLAHQAMQSLPPILCPWILVQGEQDDVVIAEDVFVWASKREPKPTVLRFPDAGHFFHGQLVELRTRLEDVLKVQE
jgi:alpha/beta superfamily hydrolase